ncbi:MAG TPA: hypothetical protein VFB66_02195 [Tepidisphaeraceae bacterium]|nr:hypothetical protein [Tepidisphaeraceae bacterium]
MTIERRVQALERQCRCWRSTAVVLAVVLIAGLALAAQQPGPGKAADAKQADSRQAKLAAAKALYEGQLRAREAGLSGVDGSDLTEQYTWSRRWMEAERDLAPDAPARRAAAAAHLDRMRPTLKSLEALFESGGTHFRDVLAARYYVAEAEQWLAEADAR